MLSTLPAENEELLDQVAYDRSEADTHGTTEEAGHGAAAEEDSGHGAAEESSGHGAAAEEDTGHGAATDKTDTTHTSEPAAHEAADTHSEEH